MNLRIRYRPMDIIATVFIFDCAVMPVIKVMGLSFKLSYIIAFAAVAFMVLTKISLNKTIPNSARKVLNALFIYIALMCFGELWSVAFYGVSVQTSFLKILIGYVLMIGSLYYGYRCKANIGNIAYWTFIVNVVINCVLALLGRSAPAFLTKLYSISVETYIDGYYRNGGMIGNPNATLLVTNMVLLLIVVLYKFDKAKLSNIQLASLYVLSIVTDIIVSSRGELLHTVLILAYLTYLVVKKNANAGKFLRDFAVVVLLIVFVVGLFWGNFAAKFPNIATSIERMTSLEELFDTSAEAADTSSIARPFFKLDVFWNRFRHSPIWGTGIDGGGNISDFEKGTTGYHNDFFMILGTAGILGLWQWIKIIKIAVKKLGICMLAPFAVTAISNTFIQSFFGTMLYFFMIGFALYIWDERECQANSFTDEPATLEEQPIQTDLGETSS